MNPSLPEDIILDIFSRLPAKSVGKCRCLSKPWRAQLSDPKFIKSHLTRQTHQQNLLLVSGSGALSTISTIKSDDGTVSRELDLSNTWRTIICSCNGLVLLQNRRGMFGDTFLVNPITQEQVQVPEPPIPLQGPGWAMETQGFGYDCVNDDYKIVSFSHYNNDFDYFCKTFVDVYSVKLGVWRRLESPSPYDHSALVQRYGAFVNGAIHSVPSDRERGGHPFVIAAFDLVHEVFYEIPPPIDLESNKSYQLYVLEGCLCLICYNAAVAVRDIWMLKEYNKEESWTKFRIYCGDHEGITKPLCFLGVEEVVLVSEGDTSISQDITLVSEVEDLVVRVREDIMVVYNFKDRSFTNMIVDGVSAMLIDGQIFTESLLSPVFNNDIWQ